MNMQDFLLINLNDLINILHRFIKSIYFQQIYAISPDFAVAKIFSPFLWNPSDFRPLIVMIKPTEGASYDNLVKVLDEMHICNIGKYAIVDITSGDKFLIENQCR